MKHISKPHGRSRESRFRGTLYEWNDDRGFGFIRPEADPADRIFVHIKELRATRRPISGDAVTFALKKQPDGRMRATLVMIAGAEKNFRCPKWQQIPTGLSAIGMLFVVTRILLVLPLLLYFAMSTATLLLYIVDKAQSKAGRWRIPERTLHTMEMAGGWPGAMVAQALIRHKVSKKSYQLVFGAIIWLHALAWLALSAFLLVDGKLPF